MFLGCTKVLSLGPTTLQQYVDLIWPKLSHNLRQNMYGQHKLVGSSREKIKRNTALCPLSDLKYKPWWGCTPRSIFRAASRSRPGSHNTDQHIQSAVRLGRSVSYTSAVCAARSVTLDHKSVWHIQTTRCKDWVEVHFRSIVCAVSRSKAVDIKANDPSRPPDARTGWECIPGLLFAQPLSLPVKDRGS